MFIKIVANDNDAIDKLNRQQKKNGEEVNGIQLQSK